MTTALDDFADFCSDLILEDRTKMELLPYQRTILAAYFEGTAETLVMIPKKNGKSSLVAALIVHHMLTTEDASVVVAAASRDQASLIFGQAVGFIRRTRKLKPLFVIRPGFREIRTKADEGKLRVLASGVDQADGVIPTLAIVDELHRFKSGELYGLFRDGLTPRHGRLITLSTAGDDELSPLGLMRARAYELPIRHHDGAYRYAASDDGQFVVHEWTLDPTDDRTDMAVVKRANPAPWHTLDELRKRFDSPSTTAWQWARFACGVWVAGEDSALMPDEWDVLREPGLVIPPGAPVWIGLDLGWRNASDTTALVPLWWESESRQVAAHSVVLLPPEGAGMLDDRAITEAILVYAGKKRFDRQAFMAKLSDDNAREAVASWADAIARIPHGFKVVGVVYDPSTGGQQVAQVLERDHGIQLFEFSQRSTGLSRADMGLMEAIRRKALVHDGDVTMRAHALNVVEVPVAGERWYFGRGKHGPRKPTDALRALAMAHDVARANDGEAPKKPGGGAWFL